MSGHFSHYFCFDKAERISSSNIRTKYVYFLHYQSTKSSMCSLMRPYAVHDNHFEDYLNSIPKDPCCLHHYPQLGGKL